MAENLATTLANASRDSADLANFVNNAPQLVQPRIGDVYPNIRLLIQQIISGEIPAEAVAEIIRPLVETAEEFAKWGEEFLQGISYATVAEGEAATATGHFFRIAIADTEPVEYNRYQRTAGGSVLAAPLATAAALASSDPDKGSALVGYGARTAKAKLDDLPTPQDKGVALDGASLGIGTHALSSRTSGEKNTAFGYEALKSITSGNENTGFGYRALATVEGGLDPVGDYNTAFGSYALASLTTGNKNTAVGRASSDFLTTGSENTAVGYGSFHWATTAVNCTAVGFEAVHGGDGSKSLTAQGITGIGWRALYECVGAFNTAVGVSAGAAITTGQRNTMMGVNALNQMVTGSDNTAIGYGAGLYSLGSGNIFIGQGADAGGNLNNVTVIGTSMTAIDSNTLLLGNSQTVIPGTISVDFGTQAKPWNYGIFGNSLYAQCNTAIPAGGSTGKGFLLSSTANFGIFFGSGAPTLSAARGSLYLRSDGSGAGDRLYINQDNGTTWTAVTTAA